MNIYEDLCKKVEEELSRRSTAGFPNPFCARLTSPHTLVFYWFSSWEMKKREFIATESAGNWRELQLNLPGGYEYSSSCNGYRMWRDWRREDRPVKRRVLITTSLAVVWSKEKIVYKFRLRDFGITGIGELTRCRHLNRHLYSRSQSQWKSVHIALTGIGELSPRFSKLRVTPNLSSSLERWFKFQTSEMHGWDKRISVHSS